MLDVVVLFQCLDQANHLGGVLAFELDVILWNHGDFGVSGRDAGFLDRFEHGLITVRIG